MSSTRVAHGQFYVILLPVEGRMDIDIPLLVQEAICGLYTVSVYHSILLILPPSFMADSRNCRTAEVVVLLSCTSQRYIFSPEPPIET